MALAPAPCEQIREAAPTGAVGDAAILKKKRGTAQGILRIQAAGWEHG